MKYGYKIWFEYGYDEQEDKAVLNLLKDDKWARSKEQINNLEKEFCDFFGANYAVTTSSGTAGIHCILASLDLGQGDEVITAANTHISPAVTTIAVGAKPVLVDVDEETLNIDPSGIEDSITPKTKALLPIHSAGHPFDIDPVMEMAEKHDLPVIHDAAQSLGAKYKGKLLGGFPHVTVFSFAKHKHINAGGYGGIVLTDDEELAVKIRLKRSQGRPGYGRPRTKPEEYLLKPKYETWGFSYNLNEISAAIARVQFKKFREGPLNPERRRSVAKIYTKLLEDIPQVRTPVEKEWAYHSYLRYIVRAERRDELFKFLREKKGIQCFIHYPVPIHMAKFMVDRFGPQEGKYPITEKTAKEVLTLPSCPQLTPSQIDYVIDSIKEFYR